MSKLQDLRIDIRDFEEWLKERGYDNLMHSDHFKIYLDVGLAGLFFSNSPLLLSFIFTKLGLPSERISPRVRIEIGRKVKEIKVGKDYLEINF